MSANVESMFSVRQIPWHKLGRILENPPTSREAIAAAGLDWTVELRNIYWKKNDLVVEIPNRYCLARCSDDKPLSIVSKSYKPLQNIEAFEWFDEFVKNGKAIYETAGSLQGGKKIWILAKLSDDFEVVPGDVVRKYILLCNGHDGITGIMIQPTPIRVVCENTLNMSLGTGMVNSIWHHGDIKEKMNRIKLVLGLAEEEFNNRKEIFSKMKFFRVNSAQIGHYINSIIPDVPEKSSELIKERNLAYRERIWQLHEDGLGANIPGVRGTMWGLYNSAIEFAEYDLPRKVRDIGNYQVFGLGAQFKNRAYSVARELVCG